MENSIIAWTNATFNPWMGCEKVSPGCAHCYAETLTKNRMADWFGFERARVHCEHEAGCRVLAAQLRAQMRSRRGRVDKDWPRRRRAVSVAVDSSDRGGVMAKKERKSLVSLAGQINRAHAAVERSGASAVKAMADAIEKYAAVGRLLVTARDALPHGQWAQWVGKNCSFRLRQAQKYMLFAEHEAQIRAANAHPSAHLTLTLNRFRLAIEPPIGGDEQREIIRLEGVDIDPDYMIPPAGFKAVGFAFQRSGDGLMAVGVEIRPKVDPRYAHIALFRIIGDEVAGHFLERGVAIGLATHAIRVEGIDATSLEWFFEPHEPSDIGPEKSEAEASCGAREEVIRTAIELGAGHTDEAA